MSAERHGQNAHVGCRHRHVLSPIIVQSWLVLPSVTPPACPQRSANESQKTTRNRATKRKQRFLQSWTDEFPWLYKDEKADKMLYAWCTSDGTPHQLADKKSSLVLGSGGEGKHKKDGLLTHERSRAHRQVDAVCKSKTLKRPMDKVITKMSEEDTKVIKQHFNTADHVARHKLPFRHYQPLCELQEKIGVHMGGCYENDKACKVFIDHISEAERNRIRHEVEKTKWISVIADGSTDHSITKKRKCLCQICKRRWCSDNRTS